MFACFEREFCYHVIKDEEIYNIALVTWDPEVVKILKQHKKEYELKNHGSLSLREEVSKEGALSFGSEEGALSVCGAETEKQPQENKMFWLRKLMGYKNKSEQNH